MRLGVEGDFIPDKDDLFRSVHFPLAFNKKNTLRRDSFWKFPAVDGQNFRETSLIWERYAPTDKYIHAYGCRVSQHRNRQPERKKPDVYCGYYGIGVGRLRGIAANGQVPGVSGVEILHWIEGEEIAHASLRVIFEEDDKSWIDSRITEFIVRAEEASQGPVRYHHADNQEFQTIASTAVIPVAAAGPYFDKRNRLEMAWCLMRFYVLRPILISRLWFRNRTAHS